jgi:hypothetical protein
LRVYSRPLPTVKVTDHASAARLRASIGTLLLALIASAGCTRGEHAAPPSSGGGASATSTRPSSQPSSKLEGEASPTAPGFDSLNKQQRAASTCYIGARYVVVERDLDNQVGSDLYVRPRGVPDTAPRCDEDSVGGDIVFRTGEAAARHPDAQHFLGLKGDLLVAWDGTGAASDLYFYDLTKRAKVLMIEDADDGNLEWLSPTTLGVWVTKAFAESAAAAGCPDTMPGNFPQLDSLMSLDLHTLLLRPTGRYRCRVGQ